VLHEPGFGLVAFAFALAGTLVARVTVLAQTAAVSTDATGIANTGIAAASVGALIWITRMVASGKLVARDPSDAEKALAANNDHLIAVNKQVLVLIDKANAREERYLALLEARLGERHTDGAH